MGCCPFLGLLLNSKSQLNRRLSEIIYFIFRTIERLTECRCEKQLGRNTSRRIRIINK